jgi:phosphoglycerate dehydrogenase-like enzyme
VADGVSDAPHRTVYVTQRAPVHQQVARAACPEELELVMLVSPATSEIIDALAGAEFLVSERARVIDEAIIEAGRDLRLIQRLGLQVHDIDLDAARRAAIPVCRWPLPQCAMVAEHVVMQLMALLKRTRAAEQIVTGASTEWGSPQRCDADTFLIDWSRMSGVRQLRDCTVGIVGLGEIGTELALRLGAFGCDLLYHRRNRMPGWAEEQMQVAYADLDDLLGRSDVVVLLLPHSPDTAGIADDRFLDRLKPGSLLINAGASALLDEQAVTRAYQSGHLGGVATDGFAWEPVRPDNPLVALAADPRANVVLTPHSAQAGLVITTAVRRAEYTNLLAVLKGGPLQHQVA